MTALTQRPLPGEVAATLAKSHLHGPVFCHSEQSEGAMRLPGSEESHYFEHL